MTANAWAEDHLDADEMDRMHLPVSLAEEPEYKEGDKCPDCDMIIDEHGECYCVLLRKYNKLLTENTNLLKQRNEIRAALVGYNTVAESHKNDALFGMKKYWDGIADVVKKINEILK